MAEIVVGVPGFWKDRADIIAAIAKASCGRTSSRYFAAGSMLLETAGEKGVEVSGHVAFEVYRRDPNLRKAFEAAGQGKLSEELLAFIERHSHTVYLIADEGWESARRLLRAADFLLEAGGLAVKVESTGGAHSPERWHYLAGSPSSLSVYEAFSVLVAGDDFNYSCGMRTFGLPDVSVTAQMPIQKAARILTAFNHWQLLEKVSLRDGDLFCTANIEPCFQIEHQPYGYDPGELLNNPHGRWHLELSDAELLVPADLRTGGEPLFMAMKRDDPELLEAVERARATLPYFLRHVDCPHEYGNAMFKVWLEDVQAYVWLMFEEAKGKQFVGSLFELPPEFSQYEVGQTLEVPIEAVHDWAIIKSGTLIGGYSMRISRSLLKPELRGAYDRMTGTLSYAPLNEIVP